MTSFGPKSIWDELYFLDFYCEGKWDGTFYIYLIPNEAIYEQNVNKGQILKEQQAENRRPRFSIQTEIIKKLHLEPIKIGNINKNSFALE